MQVNSGITVEGTDCDVSHPASVARLVTYAQAKLGRIDVWINNAGYSGSFQVTLAASGKAVLPQSLFGMTHSTGTSMQVPFHATQLPCSV